MRHSENSSKSNEKWKDDGYDPAGCDQCDPETQALQIEYYDSMVTKYDDWQQSIDEEMKKNNIKELRSGTIKQTKMKMKHCMIRDITDEEFNYFHHNLDKIHGPKEDIIVFDGGTDGKIIWARYISFFVQSI